MLHHYEPSQLDKAFVVLETCSILHTPEVSIPVVVQDRRDFRRSNIRIVQVSTYSSSSCKEVGGCKDSLRDHVDLRYFTRVKERVRGTTVCRANIKREKQLARGATVGCTNHSAREINVVAPPHLPYQGRRRCTRNRAGDPSIGFTCDQTLAVIVIHPSIR